jgi:hypothetical protein
VGIDETDFRTELRTIKTPALILQGDIDQSAPVERSTRPTHESIAGSRLTVYENAAQASPTRTPSACWKTPSRLLDHRTIASEEAKLVGKKT